MPPNVLILPHMVLLWP